jgi:hypothetical protein
MSVVWPMSAQRQIGAGEDRQRRRSIAGIVDRLRNVCRLDSDRQRTGLAWRSHGCLRGRNTSREVERLIVLPRIHLRDLLTRRSGWPMLTVRVRERLR